MSSIPPSEDYTYGEIAAMIDHALLAPTLTEADMQTGCEMAGRYGVGCVCIKPAAVAMATTWLTGTATRVGTVIGFPHGSQHTAVKVAETRQALADRAVEIDMVVNIGDVLSGLWSRVEDDIGRVAFVVREAGAVSKVIFETCYLQDSHKRELCRICIHTGVDFVKTSTGFGTGGATDEDLRLMREACPPPMAVKASGGVRDLDRVLAVRALGVTRVGTSATVAILNEARSRLGLPALTAPTAGVVPSTNY